MTDTDALEQAARAAKNRPDPDTDDVGPWIDVEFAALASPDVILRLIAAVREADALRAAAEPKIDALRLHRALAAAAKAQGLRRHPTAHRVAIEYAALSPTEPSA